ncbi:MAG TPA: hypothetical protein VFD60_13990, partial [Nitrososphaeraceae archaeon]|nr:hypothetical protein [Nitrososphaeraceae archaeon]
PVQISLADLLDIVLTWTVPCNKPQLDQRCLLYGIFSLIRSSAGQWQNCIAQKRKENPLSIGVRCSNSKKSTKEMAS